MDGYLFGEAGRQIYDFMWNDFADWYVEAAKIQLNVSGESAWTTLHVLGTVLDHTLRLLHPYIPFVSEETWQQLRAAALESGVGIGTQDEWAEALIIADWPQPTLNDPPASADFELMRDLIRRIRNARAEQGVEPGRYIPAVIAAGNRQGLLESQRPILAALARLDDDALVIAAGATPPAQAITLALGPITCYLPLAGMIDLAAERTRLEKEDGELTKQIDRLSALLNSPFAQKAPAAVVEKEREKLAALETGQAEIRERLRSLDA
ncbi:MAG TPA: class I tRNA ligase family protein, partial [Promineifilum sp.]|nr:class I tRNA ligase family protein [Promineifilum sp.]